MNNLEVRFRMLFALYDKWFQGKRGITPDEIYKDTGLQDLSRSLLDGNLEYLDPRYVRLHIERANQQAIIVKGDITPFGIDKVEEIANNSITELGNTESESKNEIMEVRNEENHQARIKKLYNMAVEKKGFILDVVLKVTANSIKGA